MNAATHTPGPWSLPHFANDGVGCDCASVLAEQYMGAVAQVCIGVDLPLGDGGNDCPPLDEAKANARLIAAAPDLLAALISLTSGAESMDVQIDSEWGSCRSIEQIEADGDMREDILEARAAIAKATGAA